MDVFHINILKNLVVGVCRKPRSRLSILSLEVKSVWRHMLFVGILCGNAAVNFIPSPSKVTDHLWFAAQPDGVQVLKPIAAISASSNLPTLQPDDVREITAQRSGRGRGGVCLNAHIFHFFIRFVRLKDGNKAVMTVLFHLSARRH